MVSRRYALSLLAAVIVASMTATVVVAYQLRDTGSAGADVIDGSRSGVHVSYPVRIIIPELAIDTRVQSVGTTTAGAMQNPSNFYDVGWYRFGARPGEVGSAVIAGHLDNALGLSGVFKHLDALPIGASIEVRSAGGEVVRFRVVRTERYRADAVPLPEVFGRTDGSYLNLITCAGPWVRSEQMYRDRLVVYAELQ